MKTASSVRRKPRRSSGTPSSQEQLVHFEFTNAAARQVCLAGSFNDWKPEISPMIRLGDGKWAKDLKLSPGCYEYRFVVDGVWMPDPAAEHMVVNQFGERNSLLTINSGCSDLPAGL